MDLTVLWKSNNIIDIENLIFPYVTNSKTQKWFSDVTLLIWGASTEFILKNKNLQERIKTLKETGINIYACKYCSDQLNATEVLEACGVTVIYTGELLSDHLKEENRKVITF